MSTVKLYGLGGLDENGKNLYCLEFENRIFVIDCGIKRQDAAQFGVDFVIPDFSYLIDNADKVAAVIITHVHDDMMDAVPYLINKVNVPVYANAAAAFSLKKKLDQQGIKGYKIVELPRYGEVNCEGVKVTTFGLTHFTPSAIGVAIETPDGQVVIAEQYIIDFDMREDEYNCDLGVIAEIGKKGVLCAMIESTYADVEGFTAPRHRITPLIRPVIEDAQGRIIITAYSQSFFRLKEIISLASEFKKKIFFYDKSVREILESGVEEGYFKLNKNLYLSEKDFRNNIEDCIIVVSGNGAQTFAAMHKIAINEDDTIELRDTDNIIIASPVVSGSEKEASAMENELYKDNVHITKLDKKSVLSMHPAVEDIKMMLYLLKPKYFLPVMGLYKDFISAANIAVSAGFTPDKIIILDNGQIATLKDGKLVSCSEMIEQIGERNINGEDNKNVTSQVLKDREALSTDGVIVIGIAVDYNTKEIIGGPDIQSRGVVYVKDSEYLIKNCSKMVVDQINEMVANGTYKNLECRVELKEKISRYVFRETGKKPMILPAIIEINLPAGY